MKTLSASLIIFIILMSCVSGAFADERLEAGYLPKDRDSIVWVSEGERGSYVGRDGNNYLFNIFPYEHDRAKFILSVTEAYSFFGFSTVPQYVVEDANQFIESNNAQASVIVTKIDPGLKNIDDCSVACREKLNEQLAKLHLAEALMAINGTHISRFNEQINYYVDQDGRLNIVCLNCSYTINSERRKIVLDIKKLIEFKHNWNKARIFQKPFLDYTLTHIPGLVSWLENIYAAKIKNQDISEGDETESGFKSIIEQLKMLQKEGYKPDGPEKISRLIKERRGRKLDKRSGFKKAYFDARDILPKIEEQILLCNDGVKVWLELTNFQSLVNGQESNKIVTVYIGDVGDKKKADRKIIEIFDPEATFVFQTEVIGWWGNNDRGISSPSKLAEAILNGFKGVSEHFDFQEKFLQEGNQSIVSIEDLIDFCNQQQEKFKSITHGIDRFVTMGTINKRKAQGLGAYYPNPIYLKSMFNYKRPQGMSYDEYLKRALEEILFGMDMACDKDDISKTDDADYNFCDEYTQILERVYPGALNNSCSSIDNIHVSEFNRKSVYAFRGNDNSLDDVYAANGFWAEGDGDAKFSDKETKERLLQNDGFWKISVCGERFCPGRRGYVSTSKILSTSKRYGSNLYVVFAQGGLSLPANYGCKNIHDAVLREIAVPSGIDWNNVIGVRGSKKIIDQPGANYLLGPVFLKEDFVENDRKNFWKILNIIGGKPQCYDEGIIEKVVDVCENDLKNEGKEWRRLILNEIDRYRYKAMGLNAQEVESLIEIVSEDELVERIDSICGEVFYYATGLDSPVSRW